MGLSRSVFVQFSSFGVDFPAFTGHKSSEGTASIKSTKIIYGIFDTTTYTPKITTLRAFDATDQK